MRGIIASFPAAPSTDVRAAGRPSLRRFHLTGESRAGERAADAPLFPAALTALRHAVPDWKLYPLVVTAPQNGVDDPGAVSLFDLLVHELKRVEELTEAPSILAPRLPEVVRIVNRQLAERDGAAPLRSTLRDACITLAVELGPKDVRVNAICPGLLYTRAWKVLASNIQKSDPRHADKDPYQVFLEIGAHRLGGAVSLKKSLKVAREIFVKHDLAQRPRVRVRRVRFWCVGQVDPAAAIRRVVATG